MTPLPDMIHPRPQAFDERWQRWLALHKKRVGVYLFAQDNPWNQIQPTR